MVKLLPHVNTLRSTTCLLHCTTSHFTTLHKGPFTHAIFDAISDAISRAKRALPYPARMLFSRSIVWIGKKVITYCLKTPFIPISANLVVFCRSVTRLKTRAGLAGAGFVRKIASKSHRNRIKNRMCKRALTVHHATIIMSNSFGHTVPLIGNLTLETRYANVSSLESVIYSKYSFLSLCSALLATV